MSLRLPRPRTVRQRVVWPAVLASALALLSGSGLFFLAFDRSLRTATQNSAVLHAQELAADVAGSPSLQAAAERIRQYGASGGLAQLIDDRGSLVAVSAAGVDQPLLDLRGSAETVVRTVDTGRAQLLAVGLPTTGPGTKEARYHVVVAMPLDRNLVVAEVVAVLTLISVLVAVVGVFFLVNRSVGAALAPVEGIRRQVAGIGGSDLSSRVDEPDTGDEIARLARTMNRMLGRLERADRSKREFVANASHELRSPIATLRANLEITGPASPLEDRRQAYELMYPEVLRLQRLVEDLLTLAKLDDQGVEFRIGDVDLDDLLAEEVRRVSAAGPRIEAELDVVRVQTDPNRLQQVVRNVIDNATRHASSRIRVFLSARDGGAVIQVDNDGPVLSAEEQLLVFDRFVRLDASRARDSGGSGLGLAIASEFITRLGGRISAATTDDGWCRFEIQLPG